MECPQGWNNEPVCHCCAVTLPIRKEKGRRANKELREEKRERMFELYHDNGGMGELRRLVKRVLRKYGYPPDMQESATLMVLEQAELLARDWGG